MTTEKQEKVGRIAKKLYSEATDWVSFYRKTIGLHGIIRHTFPTRKSLTEFEQTQTYREIQQLLTKLREGPPPPADPNEPTRVITVRLPASLHEALRVEAHEHRTSMNKLCISKLLQFIDQQMIPAERFQLPATQADADNGKPA